MGKTQGISREKSSDVFEPFTLNADVWTVVNKSVWVFVGTKCTI